MDGFTTFRNPLAGDLDGDEGDKKGEEEEYFGDAEEDSPDHYYGKAVTVDLSSFMPNDDDAGLVDEDQTGDVEAVEEMEEAEDGAAFGMSEGSGDILGASDEDDIATLLLSTAGGGQNYNSTIHMHSFLAGMAAVFLAQAGMGFLALSFFLFRNVF